MSFWSNFHFADQAGQPASSPSIEQDFARTFRVLRSLACDVFLGARGAYFHLPDKLKRLAQDGPQVFLDTAGYQTFLARNQAVFEAALKQEQRAAQP